MNVIENHRPVSEAIRLQTERERGGSYSALVSKHRYDNQIKWDEMAGHLACIHGFCREILREEIKL